MAWINIVLLNTTVISTMVATIWFDKILSTSTECHNDLSRSLGHSVLVLSIWSRSRCYWRLVSPFYQSSPCTHCVHVAGIVYEASHHGAGPSASTENVKQVECNFLFCTQSLKLVLRENSRHSDWLVALKTAKLPGFTGMVYTDHVCFTSMWDHLSYKTAPQLRRLVTKHISTLCNTSPSGCLWHESVQNMLILK